ncbi:MAG: HD-GYP domain-containing protein, partial [Lachnospiraceae bacterium]
VYICYVLVTYYFVLACVSWLRNRKYLPKGKQATFLLCIPVFMGFMVFQAFFPESLVTSLGITLLILGAYCSSENAANVELLQYHNKVVLAFAEVIESRDGSTGQHVKRTTAYVRIIAEELERRKAFPEVLSKDYLQSMLKAAPLHDFGKIAVPDAILQKPGRLTQEEYEIMKQHTVKGSDMIENTLSALEEPEDIRIAYQVARYHHERWDGGGYPEGLAGEKIPLCARVMAVADVFDAVSQKRCYREAMSLEQSFAIIAEGVGSQFDPAIAEAFLQKREEVEEIYYSFFN